MKVLHLNTHAEGGSYIYATVLSRALEESGVESRVISRDLIQRPFADKLLRRATLTFAMGAWHGTRRVGSTPDPHLLAGVDVVHLHTVADWFDVPEWLERLPARVRIVVGFHDLWHFSGGCFVHGACERFRSGCGNCPLLRFPASRLLAADEVRRKLLIYRKRGARFVANSQWLKDLASASRVVDGAEVVVIPPPVDTAVFRPQDHDACRAEYGLMPDDLVVATGCASLTDQNKDTAGLLEILSSLNEPRLRVLVFGDGTIPAPAGLHIRWLGGMKSKDQLARLYGAADVFASASRMETYGLTLVEAIACGTPVVAYRVGGIPEAVMPAKGSVRLCEPFDQDEFGQSIREFLHSPARQDDLLSQSAAAVRLHGGGGTAAKSALAVYRD